MVCTNQCALDGIDLDTYKQVYGVVAQVNNGVQLTYANPKGSIGSRLYAMANPQTYRVFHLLNREFTFDVDLSHLPCGLNGALYFVEMPANGGRGRRGNKAGAKYGTGYCDAQCPRDTKFPGGVANLKGWGNKKPMGKTGSCCAEMDMWEANRDGAAFTAHPCKMKGQALCEGEDCGNQETREVGKCDLDGCDFNSWRLGNRSFYGPGPKFAVDTTKPFTVVTQFLTNDGTDTGDLLEIRRFYMQGGRVINNSEVTNVPKPTGAGGGLGGGKFDSITEEFCSAQKTTFGDSNGFEQLGGLKQMGEALKRGMVLVISLWDDSLTDMKWLDAEAKNATEDPDKPGVSRGPCKVDWGKPKDLRKHSPKAHVKFADIRLGAIGSTTKAGSNLPTGSANPNMEVFAKFDDTQLDQRDFSVKKVPTFMPGMLSPMANILTLMGAVLALVLLVYRAWQFAAGRPARHVFVRTEQCNYDMVEDRRATATA